MSEKTRSSYRYRIVRMAADLLKDPVSLDEDDLVEYLARCQRGGIPDQT